MRSYKKQKTSNEDKELMLKNFREAINNGDLQSIKALLDALKDYSKLQKDFCKIVILAVKKNHIKIVELLIEKGADVDTKDEDGNNLLHWASWSGHTTLAELLIEKGADINIKNCNGITPLHGAVARGYIQTVRFLIEKGANVNSTADDNTTPLHCAARKGNIYVSTLFYSSLSSATDSEYIEIFKLLIKRGADVNAKNDNDNTPLYLAVKEGHICGTRFLVANGADINIKDKSEDTPLHWAVGYIEIVKLLLESGADIDAKNAHQHTPLNNALSSGFLRSGEHYMETARFLIEKGANINTKTKTNDTLLHWAAEDGNVEITELLIRKGAEINIKNNKNHTPLYLAVGEGHREAVSLLIRRGVIEDTHDTLSTSLSISLYKGYIDIIKLLTSSFKPENYSIKQREFLYEAIQDSEVDLQKKGISWGIIDKFFKNKNTFFSLQQKLKMEEKEIFNLYLTNLDIFNLYELEIIEKEYIIKNKDSLIPKIQEYVNTNIILKNIIKLKEELDLESTKNEVLQENSTLTVINNKNFNKAKAILDLIDKQSVLYNNLILLEERYNIKIISSIIPALVSSSNISDIMPLLSSTSELEKANELLGDNYTTDS